jgi:hypothetical protein
LPPWHIPFSLAGGALSSPKSLKELRVMMMMMMMMMMR